MLRLSAIGQRGLSPAFKSLNTHRQCKNRIIRTFRTSAIKWSPAGTGHSGGAGSVIAGATLFTIGVGGGVFGYAAFDDKFRKMLEESVPGSQDVFDTILGPLEAPPPKPKRDAVPPPKLKLTSPIMITKPQEEKQIVQDSAPQLEQDLSATSSEKCVNETFPQTTEVEIALPPSPPLEQPPPSLTVVSEIPVAISESPVTVEEISINVEETLTSAEEITLGETPVSVKETPNPIDENLIREENSVKVEESSPSKEITSPAEELSIKNSTVLVETESNPPEMNATSTEDASSEEIAALEEKKNYCICRRG